MNFQYNQPNLDNMQQYLKEEKNKSSNTSSTKWWSIPSGMSSIRILPPWDPKGMIALPVFMHPIEYQEKDMKYKKYNWTCLQETFGKQCKICEGLQKMKAAGVDVSKYEAGRRQFYMNAIVMYDPIYQADINAGKTPENASGVAPGTHVVMRTPKTIYDWVLSQITNPMVGDITSLTNGIDVYITKEGSGLGTKYTPTLSPNGRGPIPQEYLEKIESLYNLDEIFSTGFDDELIGRLVSYLEKSAGIISQNVPGVVSDMAGFKNPENPPFLNNQPNNLPNSNPVQNIGNNIPPNNFSGVSPNPYQTPYQKLNVTSSTTSDQVVTPTPVNSQSSGENTPKCFGSYDPANVTCVVCPFETPCSQVSGK